MMRASLLLGMLLLAGCASKPAPDLYVLRVPDGFEMSGCKHRGALIIPRPDARREYAGKRIAILLSPTKLTYYTGASWASSLPEQLRDFMADAFAQSRLYASVNDESADGAQAQQLVLKIEEAQVVNVDAPKVQLRISGSLRDGAKIRKPFRITEEVAAEANHMPEIVAAFDEAAASVAKKIAALQQCKR